MLDRLKGNKEFNMRVAIKNGSLIGIFSKIKQLNYGYLITKKKIKGYATTVFYKFRKILLDRYL